MLTLRQNYAKDAQDEQRRLEHVYTCIDEHGYTYLVQAHKFKIKYGDYMLSGDIADLDLLIDMMTDYGDKSGLPVLDTTIYPPETKLHKFLSLSRIDHAYAITSKASVVGTRLDWISLKNLLVQMQKAQRIENYKH